MRRFSLTALLMFILAVCVILVVGKQFMPTPPPKSFFELYCDEMRPSADDIYLYDEFLFAGKDRSLSFNRWNSGLMVPHAAQVMQSTINELRTAGLFEGMTLETFESIVIPAKQEVFSRYYACAPFGDDSTNGKAIRAAVVTASTNGKAIRAAVVTASSSIDAAYNDDAVIYQESSVAEDTALQFPEHLRWEFLQAIKKRFQQQNVPLPPKVKKLTDVVIPTKAE